MAEKAPPQTTQANMAVAPPPLQSCSEMKGAVKNAAITRHNGPTTSPITSASERDFHRRIDQEARAWTKNHPTTAAKIITMNASIMLAT